MHGSCGFGVATTGDDTGQVAAFPLPVVRHARVSLSAALIDALERVRSRASVETRPLRALSHTTEAARIRRLWKWARHEFGDVCETDALVCDIDALAGQIFGCGRRDFEAGSLNRHCRPDRGLRLGLTRECYARTQPPWESPHVRRVPVSGVHAGLSC
jgi:hypothetical protein